MKRYRDSRQTSPPFTLPTIEDNDIPKLSSLDAPVSPPRKRSTAKARHSSNASSEPKRHDLAAIEAGQVEVTDHLSIFSSRLSQAARPAVSQSPRLQIPDWVSLYQRNQSPEGRHFVIHQHDHPIAGPHYDLRLQFSDSSSVSWSIMYGLPGNPNSRRLNRNATETRVHCLWNHLIETASPRTGSMIIWDTGEYEILPYQPEQTQPETDDSRSDNLSDTSISTVDSKTDSEKLCQAFQNRKIRLRLHGTKLPQNYTIILRLDKNIDFRRNPTTTRKRRRRTIPNLKRGPSTSSSDSSPPPSKSDSTGTPAPGVSDQTLSASETPGGEHSDEEDDVDEQIRTNNAYPGAINSIGSVHQRRWFVTLDRVNSGFVAEAGSGSGGKRWVRKWDPGTGRLLGFKPFYVRGPEVERSVVTGRLGRDVLEDEGVEGFVPRRGWRAVLE
ncbi:DNA polymerase ligase-domain-containing protein [Aspergillus pseudocaelatus]|uniref:DNA polymerase ligase-domain-containing protein n=1 Tax=Aspergillus pseudocaelatus TaxID=1825620 RepID=A0ABQ6WAG9_9EURO|nr:DNA polymerase ligase-domain-containing protein [Aspergillus pseudocaelatus]